MVALQFDNINLLKRTHYDAILSYFLHIMKEEDKLSFYRSVVALPGFDGFPKNYDATCMDYTWLKKFILADFLQLSYWVNHNPELLRFTEMKRLYMKRFSNGVTKFVDRNNTYNAYILFRMMDIKVCPYCELEYIQELMINGKTKRTMEFDHFFPKGNNEYPSLAMCFYNLIPSCKQCNQLKLTFPIAANPYDTDIEKFSHFATNLSIGINIETTTDADCKPILSTTGDMVVNEKTLGLQQRYEMTAPRIRQWLSSKQKFSDEKIAELERMGFGTASEIKYSLFGNSRNTARGNELYTKLKEDLIGY